MPRGPAAAEAFVDAIGKRRYEFRKSCVSTRNNADALRGLGYCHLSQERYGDAISVLAKANTIEPGNVQGLVWLAQGYGMAGELDKSESTFRKVLAIDPGSQEAKTGLDTLEKSKKGKRRSG